MSCSSRRDFLATNDATLQRRPRGPSGTFSTQKLRGGTVVQNSPLTWPCGLSSAPRTSREVSTQRPKYVATLPPSHPMEVLTLTLTAFSVGMSSELESRTGKNRIRAAPQPDTQRTRAALRAFIDPRISSEGPGFILQCLVSILSGPEPVRQAIMSSTTPEVYHLISAGLSDSNANI